MVNYFYFQGNNYGKGTVVQIVEKNRDRFKFNSNLVFEEYDDNNEILYFRSLYNEWDRFNLYKHELDECIEKVVKPFGEFVQNNSFPKVKEDYVDGIASAWIWYIIIMFFGLFLKGVVNIICIWVLASVIFFSWRHNKMNGE